MSPIQRRLCNGRLLWLERGERDGRRYPRLSSTHQASVAIVSGGMTGALIAHAFASGDVSTILLEASEFGRGSTAASSALLLQEPDLELTELTTRYGEHAARRIWQMSRESVYALVRLLERLRIAAAPAARLLLERWQGRVTRDHTFFEFGRTRRRGARLRFSGVFQT